VEFGLAESLRSIHLIKPTVRHKSSRQAEYLKSKIPPGLRPLRPLWAGGRNPKSKIDVLLSRNLLKLLQLFTKVPYGTFNRQNRGLAQRAQRCFGHNLGLLQQRINVGTVVVPVSDNFFQQN
jgi:hypothetical protein